MAKSVSEPKVEVSTSEVVDAPVVAPPAGMAPMISIETLAAALSAAQGPQVKRVPFGQQVIRSPFNKAGRRDRKLVYQCYQNSALLRVETLHDDEIALLNSGRLKAGKFINKLVVVDTVETVDGTSLSFSYRAKTADQRQTLANELANGVGKTGFARMMDLCIKEYEQTQQDIKDAKKREMRALMDEEAHNRTAN